VSPEARRRLLDRLAQAVLDQDQASLIKLLAEEVTWTSDGGGKAKAAKKVVHGARHVARFATGVLRKYVADLQFRPLTVNGEAGMAAYFGDRLIAVMTIRTDGRRILDVFSILNPDKLRGLSQ
jgi:RNA polymerase sigma-70 factor (ECF subfamily)